MDVSDHDQYSAPQNSRAGVAFVCLNLARDQVGGLEEL